MNPTTFQALVAGYLSTTDNFKNQHPEVALATVLQLAELAESVDRLPDSVPPPVPGYTIHVPDEEEQRADRFLDQQPNLGLATTAQLCEELDSRLRTAYLGDPQLATPTWCRNIVDAFRRITVGMPTAVLNYRPVNDV